MLTTMGKYRHLSRAATAEGHFVIMAIDHRTNLLEQLNQYAPGPLNDAQFMSFKQEVLAALAPHASAVLTDPAYGIGAGITSGVIDGRLGLLAPIEVTDYSLHPSQRALEWIPNWSVQKIKGVGGDGVKLLLPYHPDAENADEKHTAVQQVVEQCSANQIPFFLEPIPYSLDPAQTLRNEERLRITLAMCETFSAMGVDILKLPFPLDHKQSDDPAEWQASCEAVTAACRVPWALLSAGVNYDTFAEQVRVACAAGASGVIVGRAVWAEAVKLQGAEREDFLRRTAVERMDELAGICRTTATPWQEVVELPAAGVDWYEA